MKRVTTKVREDWKERLEAKGFGFHTINGEPYWREGVGYGFSAAEIDRLEEAGNELSAMCNDLAEETVQKGSYEKYGFPRAVIEILEASYRRDKYLDVFSRLDLGYDGKRIVLFENNADTPTSLPESSVWQWFWLEDLGLPDQFNLIHESAVDQYKNSQGYQALRNEMLYFTAMAEAGAEDWNNLAYRAAIASEAGFDVSQIELEQIGWSKERNTYTDVNEREIKCLTKLYPTEWMLKDEFGWNAGKSSTRFAEPLWKALLLSTKALLPILWERHPNHPNLLPAYFETDQGAPRSGKWARKPVRAREGANISIVENGKSENAPGSAMVPAYDESGYVYQGWFEQSIFDGQKPVLGVWLVAGVARGMGIREDSGVTGNASCFVPHWFE